MKIVWLIVLICVGVFVANLVHDYLDPTYRIIYPWTKQPPEIDIAEFDRMISEAAPESIIIIREDGTLFTVSDVNDLALIDGDTVIFDPIEWITN